MLLQFPCGERCNGLLAGTLDHQVTLSDIARVAESSEILDCGQATLRVRMNVVHVKAAEWVSGGRIPAQNALEVVANNCAISKPETYPPVVLLFCLPRNLGDGTGRGAHSDTWHSFVLVHPLHEGLKCFDPGLPSTNVRFPSDLRWRRVHLAVLRRTPQMGPHAKKILETFLVGVSKGMSPWSQSGSFQCAAPELKMAAHVVDREGRVRVEVIDCQILPTQLCSDSAKLFDDLLLRDRRSWLLPHAFGNRVTAVPRRQSCGIKGFLPPAEPLLQGA
jgi:hypothetical protein